MKAVVVRAPMEFGVEEVAEPVTPAGGLLLDVKACGLCGSDLRTLRSGHRKVTLPYIIGHEICGVVAETGAGYAGAWQIGDLLSMGAGRLLRALRFLSRRPVRAVRELS